MAANAAVAIARLGGRPRTGDGSRMTRLARGSSATSRTTGIDVSDAPTDSRMLARPSRRSSSTRTGDRLICSFADPALDQDAALASAGQGARDFDVVLADVRWPAGSEALLRRRPVCGRPALLDADVGLAGGAGAPLRRGHATCCSPRWARGREPGRHAGDGLAQRAGPASPACRRHALGRGLPVARGRRASTGRCPPKIDPVDTLAAGDVWHGAFALALAEGRAPGRRPTLRQQRGGAQVPAARRPHRARRRARRLDAGGPKRALTLASRRLLAEGGRVPAAAPPADARRPCSNSASCAASSRCHSAPRIARDRCEALGGRSRGLPRSRSS